MCFGSSKKGDDAGAKKNAEIEKRIKQDQKKDAREVKVLLLGKAALSIDHALYLYTHLSS